MRNMFFRGSVSIIAVLLFACQPERAVAGEDVSAATIDYQLSAVQVSKQCDDHVRAAEEAFNRIVTQPIRNATFASVLLPLENTQADLNDELIAEQLAGSISSDRAVRDASNKCQSTLDHMLTRVNSRPELSRLLHAVASGNTAQTTADRKLLQLWTASVDRTGARLSPSAHQEYLSLSRRLDDLQTAYMANLSNATPLVTITAAQTAGLPPEFIRSAVGNAHDGYTFPVDESTHHQFLSNASDPAAREAFYRVYENRGFPENEPILREALSIRLRLARLLGYSDWASYILADRMAQTPRRVHTFLDGLDRALLPAAHKEVDTLARIKASDLHVTHAVLEPWDVTYYDEQLRRTKYALDTNTVRRYFPASYVIPGVLSIYSRMLGIVFSPVVRVHAWADDVQEFAVANAADHRFIGTLYLDLYPRPGKYTHFASFPLLPTRMRADGSLRPPIDAIIGNWSRPTVGEAATLTHQEVETFFHEFGHAMATLLATAPYETLSEGFRTDFVEAPSQMLENFVWTPSILKQLSQNVTDGAPLPDDLINKIIAARHVNDAMFNTQQIVYADTDLAYHSSSLVSDLGARWRQISAAEGPITPPVSAHPEASFGHIMAGYDAGYYGYLWSRVYAQDLFTAFEADGVESPTVGMHYRSAILEPARTTEPDAEVQAFLGRPSNPAAFYRDLGIKAWK
jgi:thimet oligopeptidase